MSENELLQIEHLTIELRTKKNRYNLVEDVSFSVGKKEVFGIVGESGCGKSVTAYSIIDLLATPPLYISRGRINFEGRDLTGLSNTEMRKIRGNAISMIFQEPMTALDPLFTIGQQLKEILHFHYQLPEEVMHERAVDILRKVEIPRAEQLMKEYPHQLSGGMLQRVMIAMALLNNPKLLIADEPTTALDVTIQAQILDLINGLKERFDTSVIMITHDLGVISETCDRVAVLYAGHVVEVSDVETIFSDAMHPYTKGLVRSVTSLGEKRKELYTIPGVVPSIDTMGRGCRFYDRCSRKMERCRDAVPALKEYGRGHLCRCWLFEGSEHE
ncbi:ABC transporter ATP-binding protein [Sediminispirochaeta bajacaliforniensis]|uniref:ABC transporter ATP-binding protein n=1 Tax=Sediminispirochaeta bajacaliforniensis TaxID=148 RepID=UPI00037E5342|nr:ABC transporter ATP-binding protein [Sediminispirochaeta bajacaliforniensis]